MAIKSLFDERTEILDQHTVLWNDIQKRYPLGSSLILAVDGRDSAGKSPLAKFLAWSLNLSIIQTDLYIVDGQGKIAHDYGSLRKHIQGRLNISEPLVIEGVCILRTLERVGFEHDYLVYVEDKERHEKYDLKEELDGYHSCYDPIQKADFVFRWESPPQRDSRGRVKPHVGRRS